MDDNQNDFLGLIAVVGFWLGIVACEIHGLYLSAHEGVGSLVFALLVPPWAVIKGFIGFF